MVELFEYNQLSRLRTRTGFSKYLWLFPLINWQIFQLLSGVKSYYIQDSIAHNTSLTFTKRISIPKRKTGPKKK